MLGRNLTHAFLYRHGIIEIKEKGLILFPWPYALATLFLAFNNTSKKKKLICCLCVCECGVLFLAVNIIHCLSHGLEPCLSPPKIPAISCANPAGICISQNQRVLESEEMLWCRSSKEEKGKTWRTWDLLKVVQLVSDKVGIAANRICSSLLQSWGSAGLVYQTSSRIWELVGDAHFCPYSQL